MKEIAVTIKKDPNGTHWILCRGCDGQSRPRRMLRISPPTKPTMSELWSTMSSTPVAKRWLLTAPLPRAPAERHGHAHVPPLDLLPALCRCLDALSNRRLIIGHALGEVLSASMMNDAQHRGYRFHRAHDVGACQRRPPHRGDSATL